MGVKNFIKLVKYYTPEAIRITNIKDYSNKVLGIDTNLMIYKNTLAIRKKGDLFNENIMVTHVHSMLNKLLAFEKYNITPIFVFDGKYPSIKQKVMEERSLKKEFNIENEIKDCIKLISYFGYKIIYAHKEADIVLADLSRKGEIDYIVSEDMDILVFGGKNILKGFTVNPKNYIIEVDLSTILEKLSITRRQLIDIAIILGTDYHLELANSIVGIGPIKVVPFIKKIGKLDSKIILDKVTYRKIIKYYKNSNPTYTTITKPFNKNKIIRFLKKLGYSDKYLDRINTL